MTALTRDMVLDRTRLLAGITRREMAVVAGLYERSETAAAYVEAAAPLNDEFDASGMPGGFCPACEHAPCVSQYARHALTGRCGDTPRDLSVSRVAYPIHDAARELTGQARKVYDAMALAVDTLQTTAVYNDNKYIRVSALNYLVRIRDDMRRVVAS